MTWSIYATAVEMGRTRKYVIFGVDSLTPVAKAARDNLKGCINCNLFVTLVSKGRVYFNNVHAWKSTWIKKNNGFLVKFKFSVRFFTISAKPSPQHQSFPDPISNILKTMNLT